jgi:hypothetical protein
MNTKASRMLPNKISPILSWGITVVAFLFVLSVLVLQLIAITIAIDYLFKNDPRSVAYIIFALGGGLAMIGLTKSADFLCDKIHERKRKA